MWMYQRVIHLAETSKSDCKCVVNLRDMASDSPAPLEPLNFWFGPTERGPPWCQESVVASSAAAWQEPSLRKS